MSASTLLSTIDYLLQFINIYDEFNGLNIIAYQPNLIVIKNALTPEEQCKLFETIDLHKTLKSQPSFQNTNNRFRYAHFMRLNLSQTETYIQKCPIYDETFKKIINIIRKYNQITFGSLSKDEIHKLKQKKKKKKQKI
eukprot:28919_1